MMSYLTIRAADGAPPHRVEFNGIARLFVETIEQDSTPPQVSILRRAAAALRATVAPLDDFRDLLRAEGQARRMEAMTARALSAWVESPKR